MNCEPHIADDFLSFIYDVGDKIYDWIDSLVHSCDVKNKKKKLDLSLYDGLAGNLFFLVELYKITKQEKYLSAVIKGYNKIKKNHFTDSSLSCYLGLGGMILVLIEMYQLTNDESYILQAKTIVINNKGHNTSSCDMLKGKSGEIITLLHLHNQVKEDWIIDEIIVRVDYILLHAIIKDDGLCWDIHPGEIQSLCGFSHGASGIAFTFIELSKYFNNKDFLWITEKAFNYENSLFHKNIGNWPDFRQDVYSSEAMELILSNLNERSTNQAIQPRYLSFWCHGAPGIGMARLHAYNVSKNTDHLNYLKVAIDNVLSVVNSMSNYSLCHGLCGNANLFIDEYIKTEERKINKCAIDIAIDFLDNGTNKIFTPSLFLGTTGIAYYFLRLLYPDQVFSILTPHQVKYYVNNSLYEVAGSYRYIEYTLHNRARAYNLNSFDKNEYVDAIFNCAREGATINEMALLLKQLTSSKNDETLTFVDQMIKAQLLLSELEPCITGNDPLHNLIQQLQNFKGVENILMPLKNVQSLIQNPKGGVDYYKNIEAQLQELDPIIKIPKNTLQTDLFLSAKTMQIQKDLIENILAQLKNLSVFIRRSQNADLQNFISRFNTKYEKAEVPLNVALDLDLGIGYAGAQNLATWGSDLIDDIIITGNQNTGGGGLDYIRRYVIKKHTEYLKNNTACIEITTDELNSFKGQTNRHVLPKGMYIVGNLLKNGAILDKENYTFALQAMGGPSAANWLGRFAYGDQELADFVKELTKSEEQEYPEAIYAEIVHLPKSRLGNIMLRPILREYEIPYIGKSGVPKDHQIPVDDIMVSIQNNIVVLRSKKNNKRIIPRMSNAHNFSARSLPVYKFLCDLQMQGKSYPCIWDWGNLSILRHLPRVKYKNIILKKERWQVLETDIIDLPKESSEYIPYFRQFREKHKIYQQIVIKQHDNELLIDLELIEHINLLIEYIRKYKVINLEEFLFTEDNCIIKDVNGAPYTDEIIIPIQKDLKQTNIKTNTQQIFKQEQYNPIKRIFVPNSEWLYFKIYCSHKVSEQIMKEAILPFVEKGELLNLYDKFFFIRYNDGFPHIRIRFYNSNIHKQIELQAGFLEILQPYVDYGVVDKILLDTYTRELERYNPNFIEDAESIFFIDSLAILRFIKHLKSTNDNKQRLFFAMRGIDALLSDFNFSMSSKSELLKIMQNNYYIEFGGSLELQRALNTKYRNYQNDIFSYLNPDNDINTEFNEYSKILKRRSEKNMPLIDTIYQKLENSNVSISILLMSYIHMFMNRLFMSQQRKCELVIYHFLDKYYKSKIAIEKTKKNIPGVSNISLSPTKNL